MTDRLKVYSKVLATLKKMMPSASQCHVIVLAMMVAGIVTGKQAQLSKISLQIPGSAKPQSLEKRLRRFVKNGNVNAQVLFLPFAEAIVRHLGSERLILTMDGSQVGRKCMVLMVAVVYRKRALPLTWLVYKGKKGHTTAERHKMALQQVSTIVPPDAAVVLLGDAEYDTVAMLKWVIEETAWLFVMRTAPNQLMTGADGVTQPIGALCPQQGHSGFAIDAQFTAQALEEMTLVGRWELPYKRPLCLVSNHNLPDEVVAFYGKRFKIETLFSDKKSRGFNLHKSHLSDPARLGRLILATALAYISTIYLGLTVAADEGLRQLVDRTERIDKSLFRLGCDWLEYVLTRGLDFKVLFSPPQNPVLGGVPVEKL